MIIHLTLTIVNVYFLRFTKKLQKPPIQPDNHPRHSSCPAYGIRARFEHWELAVHVVVHQGGALIGFLQHGVDDDAPGDAFQFHDGRAHHERDIPGAVYHEDRLRIHAAGIRDDCPGYRNRTLYDPAVLFNHSSFFPVHVSSSLLVFVSFFPFVRPL